MPAEAGGSDVGGGRAAAGGAIGSGMGGVVEGFGKEEGRGSVGESGAGGGGGASCPMLRPAAGVSPAGAVHGSGSARLLPAEVCETLMRTGPRTISKVGESAEAAERCFARGDTGTPARLAGSGTALKVTVLVRGEKWPPADGVTAEPAEPARGEDAPDKGRADTGRLGAAPADADRGDAAPEGPLAGVVAVAAEGDGATAAAGGGGGRENSAACVPAPALALAGG